MAEAKDDDLEELEEVDDVADVDELGEDEDEVVALAPEEDEEGDAASLEELLAQRAAGRRAGDDADEEDDIMALVTEPDVPVTEPLPAKVIPLEDRKEFVCNNCHLVKARVQLADAERGLCRDCV